MDNRWAFLVYPRANAPRRPASERIGDWNDIHAEPVESLLREQGARCMECGIPFCQTGGGGLGASPGCPIGNPIPDFNHMVSEGRWRDAVRVLETTNNFPEFTGRICPAPCEAACTVGICAPPVMIEEIEHAISDWGYEHDAYEPIELEERTGKTVAVVGSGPAGLACADQLNRAGHEVTVYERADRAGGLLTYGIPKFKLPQSVVDRRLKRMFVEGVKFHTGVTVGTDVTLAELRKHNDAVALCLGATAPRDLNVPGRDLQGVLFAMDYLHQATAALLEGDNPAMGPLSAKGRDVIVIGGGDTGADCVATALRQGCRSVHQFQYREAPPDACPLLNPWPVEMRPYRLEYAHEEGRAKQGDDPRRYSTMTREMVGDAGGRVERVRTVEVDWTESGGLHAPEVRAGTEREWPATLVILAIGFAGPEESLFEQLGLESHALKSALDAPAQYRTPVEGVYLAGDARRGASLVVWAIHEGRTAARVIDQDLMGSTNLP